MIVDPEYKKFATKKQWAYYQSYCEFENYKKVAEEFGVDRSTANQVVNAMYKAAAKRGYSPDHGHTRIVPEGLALKGTSTLYDEEGNIKIQWVKTDREFEDMTERVKAAVEVLADDCKGHLEHTEIAAEFNTDQLSVYPVTDCHVGMLSWGLETGHGQDLDIITNVLKDTFSQVVESQPHSAKATLVFMGDYFHADTDDKMTKRSGHVLDVDGRCDKVFRRGVDIAKHMIQSALFKHQNVDVIVLPGNHDDQLAMAMRYVLHEYATNEPRLNVVETHGVFEYEEFGNTLLAWHHGHTTKMKDMPSVMANDRREAWGRTKYAHAMTGHLHSERSIDVGGCKVEQFRAPCAKDAWTHECGYRAPRSMYGITFHKAKGECGRTVINISPEDFE